MDGKRLLEIAKTCGLSQSAIAKHLGVNRVVPHYWAHGTRPIPAHFYKPLMDLIAETSKSLCAAPWGPNLEEDRKRLATMTRAYVLLREFMLDATAQNAHRALDFLQDVTHDNLDMAENAQLLVTCGTALSTYGEVLQAVSPLLKIYKVGKGFEDAHASGELAEPGDDGQSSAVNQ